MSYAVAEAMFVLARSQDVIIAAKTHEQRTPAENERVKRGLFRSLILAAVLFVPTSTFVVLSTIRHLLPSGWMAAQGAYGMLGMIAYAFPFVTFQKVVVLWTIHNLRGFSQVLSQTARADLDAASTQNGSEEKELVTGTYDEETSKQQGQSTGPERKRDRSRKVGASK